MAPNLDMRPPSFTYPDTKKQRKAVRKVSVPADVRDACPAMPKKWYSLLLPRRDRPSARLAIPDHDPETGRIWMLAAHEFGAESRSNIAASSEPEDAAVLMADLEPLDDPAAAGLAWLVTARTVHDVDRSVASPLIVDWWIAARGLDFAIEAYAETCKWRLRNPEPSSSGHYSPILWSYGGFGNDETAAVYRLDAPFANRDSWQLALRLSHHLVHASEAEVQQACRVGLAAGLHQLDPSLPMVLNALDARLAPSKHRGLTVRRSHPAGFALNDVRRVDELFEYLDTTHLDGFGAQQVGDPLPTLLDRFGPELVPWLDAAITHGRDRGTQYRDSWPASVARDLGTALAWIATPEAIGILVKHRGDRWIAEALDVVEETVPEVLLAALEPHLADDAVRRRFERLQRAKTDATAAAASSTASTAAEQPDPADLAGLPEVLREPRWLNRRPVPDPIVLPDLEPIQLEDTVHPELLAEPVPEWMIGGQMRHGQRGDVDTVPVAVFDKDVWNPYPAVAVVAQCSDERLTQIFDRLDVAELHIDVVGPITQLLIERFSPNLMPALLALAEQRPTRTLEPLLALSSTRLAPIIAKLHAQRAPLRKHTEPWLRHHPEAGALGTLPLLVDPDPKTRACAGPTLNILLDQAPEEVEAAAHRYGEDMVRALAEHRALDPLDLLPKRMPKLPTDLDLAVLPAIRLTASDAVLPDAARSHLVTMLMISSIDEPYAGLAPATEALDPASLEAFAWELFLRWSDAGFPSKSKWMFAALGHCGTDETVRRLEPLLRAWPSERASKRATDGLGLLGAIGTDYALTRLYDMSRTLTFKGLKKQAEAMIEKIALAKGLTTEQLADRTVPDLGLDADGRAAFNYGSTTWTAVLTDDLTPIVIDADGKTRKSAPPAGAADDDDAVAAAKKAFIALKKEAKSVAKDQIARHESAMVEQRRWPIAEFREWFIDHPVTFTVVRRTVWGEFSEDGSLRQAFRVAEDRTFANHEDDTIKLSDDAIVGIVHPVELTATDGDPIAQWVEVFDDYELLQPFPQLARPVVAPTPQQASQSELTLGTTTSEGRLLALRHRGWSFYAESFERRLLGATFRLAIDDYIDMSYVQPKREITLTTLAVIDGGGNPMTLGDVSPIAASEVLGDLAHLTR